MIIWVKLKINNKFDIKEIKIYKIVKDLIPNINTYRINYN